MTQETIKRVQITRKPMPVEVVTEESMGVEDETAKVRAKEFLQTLRRNHVGLAEMLPLQREVNKILFDMYPMIPRRVINMAMFYHTSCYGYLERIAQGYGRFTVDKKYVEEITDEERAKAIDTIRKVKAKLFRPQKSKEFPKVEYRNKSGGGSTERVRRGPPGPQRNQ